MNALMSAPPSQTMTSIDLLGLVNDYRSQHGEPTIRTNDFHARVADELEGDHYESFVVQNLNKTTTTAFALTLDQCTLVAMRESKGVRRNVLERLKALQTVTLPNFLDPAEAAEAWAFQFRARQALQNQITEQAPKVAFADSVCSAVNSVSVGDFAKMVSQDGFIIGQNKLFAWLRDQGFLMRRGNMPYQKYIDCGWFEVIEQEFATPTGIRVNSKTLITGRGQLQIHARLIV
jgi:phage antirepressor YoqD-like protein